MKATAICLGPKNSLKPPTRLRSDGASVSCVAMWILRAHTRVGVSHIRITEAGDAVIIMWVEC